MRSFFVGQKKGTACSASILRLVFQACTRPVSPQPLGERTSSCLPSGLSTDSHHGDLGRMIEWCRVGDQLAYAGFGVAGYVFRNRDKLLDG